MKFRQAKTKISLKLIITVGIVTAAIISVYSYLSIQAQRNELLSQAELSANKLSETLKKSMHSSMLLNKQDQTHAIINASSEEACILEIRIFNKEGRIMYSSQKDAIGEMVDKKTESCYACHTADEPIQRLSFDERTRIYKIHPDSARILAIINPIYNENSCWQSNCHVHNESQTVLGVLDVKMCLKDVDAQIVHSENRSIIFALIAIALLSLIIGIFVRKWVEKPVNELVTATNQVGTGNLNYIINDLGSDELGLLAKSFNNMTNKLAEARMQIFQSDKMASLGRLAAGVAHEINNPLTAVLTYSSFLLKRVKNNPELEEDLKVIVKETKRSREIVKSLLDFARQSVPKKNNADVNEIINSSISVVENQISLKQIKLEMNLDKNLPQVKVDSNQIQQVFINLLVNASDAVIEKNGKISVTSKLANLSPFGTLQIKNAVCSKRHSLIDEEVKIDGMPTIKIKVKDNSNEGCINIDPIYGKNKSKYSLEIKDLDKVQLSCPKCNVSLTEKDANCPKCKSNIYSFEAPPYGMFEGCVNSDCNWQQWSSIDEAGVRDYIEIKVSDNGCGISKDDLQKIFDPFYSTKGQKGTGLGLAVVWGILDNHDGSINVESEAERGTTFTILLPVKQNV
ncbi:MAG: HAMP domain-containing protein [Ignavibacteriaceae bacterium]|nr:HAMP domain-containing protein [Ignavibacteriaceae bacterium]